VNLPGVQTSVPPGYAHDQGGICSLLVDYCPNIEGAQYVMPAGFVVNDTGDCLLDNPTRAPRGSHPSVNDVCRNISGLQSTVPVGYSQDVDGNCIPDATDYCPNLPGNQYDIPNGYVIDNGGNCFDAKSATVDFAAVPSANANNGSTTTGAMIGYSFVPDVWRIASRDAFIKATMIGVAHLPIVGNYVLYANSSENLPADFTSVIVSVVIAILLFLALVRSAQILVS
jgi:hypothetical protein